MKAIFFVFLILMMAVTSTASAAVRVVVPPQGGTVQADAPAPACALDMKNAPAGATLSEFVINVLRKGVWQPMAAGRRWRMAESDSPLQTSRRGQAGCLRYPMRN
jgi:hypothetical protein